MKKTTVLITGGAGFIGSHLADALASRGYRVRILDNLLSHVHAGSWPSYVRGKGYELIRGDVRERRDLLRALRGASYIFHFAAYQDQRPDFSTFFGTNTVSTALLYELIVAKKLPIKKIILASSQFVYGDGAYRCVHRTVRHVDSRKLRMNPRQSTSMIFYPELRTLEQLKQKQWDISCPHGSPARFMPFREDQPLHPTNSYGLSKQALEQIGLRLGKTYGIPTTVLRYSIVQGSRQSPQNLYSGALRIFVSQALAMVPITVYEDGRATRDFVNVHDVNRANLLILKNPLTDYKVLNVGGGTAYRILDFAKLVKQITDSPSEIIIGAFRRTDTRHAVSDISKLTRLGWRPRRALADSIREYVKWFKEEGFDRRFNRARLKILAQGIKT